MAAPHIAGLIAALMTNGSYGNKKAKKLKKDIEKKFTIDIGAEGKDSATGVGFATFLSKTEFDDFWQRYAVRGSSSFQQTKIQAQTY